MKCGCRPVRTTIIYGLLCGLFFVPLVTILRPFFPWSGAVSFVLWLALAGYGIILAGWGGKNKLAVFFPLVVLLVFSFWHNSVGVFAGSGMVILSWVRSGICFTDKMGKRITAELVICAGGGLLVTGFVPQSPVMLALGLWMFFLVQSLYFVVLDDLPGESSSQIEADPFDQARREAEKLLSNVES
ncbi:MAG: hypothetical protein KKB30_05930 [Proteobacteria bacterium]|nr:hypothetical protein [Pseudomonadota bacterium]MBU1716239.1 hypothetical protein [Pseudomonadota bacterium]